MPANLLTGANPVLTRELRASLRNARAFALLSVYVAVLGAIVVSQFPSNQEIPIERSGGSLGQGLFQTFIIAQAFLVVVLFPALASGALAQERERRTLEPLLMTPLTPLQIVWGKAGGVLSLAALLLVSTLPLTSLSFLLGGVSPGELIAAYIILLGLALFTTGIGLYCSARWPNTTQATVACYVMLPFLLGFIALFSGVGIMVSGFLLIGLCLYGVVLLWRRWSNSRVALKLGAFWQPLLWIVLTVLVLALLALGSWSFNLGIVVFVVFFVTSYFVIMSQWGLLQAAQEIARRPEPEGPMRQRFKDWKDEWQRNASSGSTQQVVRLPDPATRPVPTSTFAATVSDATSTDSSAANPFAAAPVVSAPPPKSTPHEPTYGVQPFLSDKLNPVFAKDMRSGLMGRFEYLFRFSYIMVIASELFLLFVVAAAPGTSASDEQAMFTFWAKLHLGLVMVGAAWLGSRAIAPEREQQTLQQLFTTPLTPAVIVQGKIMAVMVYSLYILVMGVPLVLLLAALDVVPVLAVFYFLLAELVFGAAAAAWGICCSLQCVSVRRAMGTSLGGVLAILLGAPLLMGVMLPALHNVSFIGKDGARLLSSAFDAILPLQALQRAFETVANQIGLIVNNASDASPALLLPVHLMAGLVIYGFLTVALLFWTVRLFRQYAQSV